MRVAEVLEEVMGGNYRGVEQSAVDDLCHDFRREVARLAQSLDPAYGPIRIPKQRLSQVLRCERSVLANLGRPFTAGLAVVLGQMVDRALHHHVLCGPLDPAKAYDVAIDALAAESMTDSLDVAAGAEAWLRSNLEQHSANLVESLGVIDQQWWPRCERVVRVDLADGAVVATGVFDLHVGSTRTSRPSVIVEVKSGGRHAEHHSEPRWYALLEALQCGAPPLATAVLWTADSTCLVEPVRLDSLESAARWAIDGIGRLISLAVGQQPTTMANPTCGFCLAKTSCAAGQSWTDQTSELDFSDGDPDGW